ncbi:MAG: PIN domain-containing protein [Thermomicrobiales bacterium]
MASQTHRVFLDSSVLIAAAISTRGSARDLLYRGLYGDIRLIISPLVLRESERNIRAKVPHVLDAFAVLAEVLTDRVTPTQAAVEQVAEIIELKDAAIVAAAMAAQAEYLATYDRKHLLAKRAEIAETFGIVVATPDEIIAAISPE